MPSSNGVYSLPPGYLAVTGATIEASQHNPPLEDIAAALTLRLSRDGTAPMIGPVQLASGTVSAPGQVFSVDPTSGFYKTTAGIGVAISGVKVAEFVAGGVIGSRYVGELIPFTGTAPPSPLTVLPFGQTLSRITYAALWAFAQIEIAAGSTLYNNGDGSTTFGIMDMRGRVPAAWDSMGGTAAGRLSTAGSGVDGTTLGTGGGAQNVTLLTTNFPPYTPVVTVTSTLNGGSGPNTPQGLQSGTGGLVKIGGTGNGGSNIDLSVSSVAIGTAQGGTSTPVFNVQPTLVTNCILFVGDAA
jgi:microcystin-dependent protein